MKLPSRMGLSLLIIFVLSAVSACGFLSKTAPDSAGEETSVSNVPTSAEDADLMRDRPDVHASESGSGVGVDQVVGPGTDTPTTPENSESPQKETFIELTQARPPERDDLELARAYAGWQGVVATPQAAAEPLRVGTVQTINVLNHDLNTIEPISAELLAVGEHAYFWFDTGPGSFPPSTSEATEVSRLFDQIYEQSVELFGSESNPGIDGDPRLHVVNASPMAMCDVGVDSTANCGIAGTFSSFDANPTSVDPDSNARDMFVMNASYFGSDFYLNVLTHELRHMIEDNLDKGDDDWVAEGAATLAEDLLGYNDNPVARANLFLEEPDRQLNNWTDGYTIPHYGQGYLLNRYLYDRLGLDLYSQFGAHPDSGLAAIDSLAKANNLGLTGEGIWLDWLVTLAIHDREGVPERYSIGITGLNSVAMLDLDNFPIDLEDTLHQYAADTYRLTGREEVTIQFSGEPTVPVLDARPVSGERMWLSNRSNYSHMRLSREVDLSKVDSASLQYNVYYDIEVGYDFAYVFVSEDGGTSWLPLVADAMQGLAEVDDPAGTALSERFYTGRSNLWRRERIDLTPYSGQRILIRFVYITDPILTFGGIALDDIAIPEIDFIDDAETVVGGWTAEGFSRVTATIPQQWHLQLITFPDSVPVVQILELSSDQTAVQTLSLRDSDREAILIVAATAPMTLELAHYQLEIED